MLDIRRAGTLAAAVLVVSCVAAEEEERDIGVIHEPLRVCAGDHTLDGIDVSYWQGEIDWDAVAGAGVTFAFIRVGDGLFEDPRFDENWAEARRVGVVRGVYQFFRPGTDPVDQAEILIGRMGALEPGDLPPVVDVEATDGQSASVIVSRLHEWLDRVEVATGRVPIIYTAKYFWQDSVAASDEFLDHPLWVAHWEIDCPDTPAPWTEWAFWQTSDSGSVPGISGGVDTDLFDGDWEALMDFASGEAACGDGHCTGDETHDTCPEDCPACDPIPPTGRVVDETEVCFEAGGPSDSWWSEAAGWNGSLMWTYATDLADRENYGVWHLEFEVAGT
jgi:lysozyme